MLFNVIGNFLAFTGSVIFSAGLLQSRSQIEDENKTYFNANPYTINSRLNYRSKNIIAFFLIVTGFAITLGGELGDLASLNTERSTLVSILTATAGYLIILLIYLINGRRHKELKLSHSIKVFYSALNGLLSKYEHIIGQHNEPQLFSTYKAGDIESLKKRMESIPTEPEKHMREIIGILSRKRKSINFVQSIKAYLSQHSH